MSDGRYECRKIYNLKINVYSFLARIIALFIPCDITWLAVMPQKILDAICLKRTAEKLWYEFKYHVINRIH